MNLLLERTRPPLVVSRTVGDAVLSYAFDESFRSGQTVVELIEDCYIAFRRAIDLMVLNTTCTCNACRRIDSLDLKFFVHHGEFAIQRLDDHDESRLPDLPRWSGTTCRTSRVGSCWWVPRAWRWVICRMAGSARRPRLLLFELVPTETGTRFTQTILGATGPLIRRWILSAMLKGMRGRGQRDAENFRDHVEGRTPVLSTG